MGEQAKCCGAPAGERNERDRTDSEQSNADACGGGRRPTDGDASVAPRMSGDPAKITLPLVQGVL